MVAQKKNSRGPLITNHGPLIPRARGKLADVRTDVAIQGGIEGGAPKHVVPVEFSRSYPGGRFKYDPTAGGTGGYTFNLKTTGPKPGTYELFFTIGDDLTLHFVEFVVR
jgi:hypothetical protein